MSELKPCPFCGSEPIICTDDEWSRNVLGMVSCRDDNCLSANMWVPEKQWNTRPIEDKLQAELVRVQMVNEQNEIASRQEIERLKTELAMYKSDVKNSERTGQ